METDKDLKKLLAQLQKEIYKREEELQKAACRIGDPELKNVLEGFATQSETFGKQLQQITGVSEFAVDQDDESAFIYEIEEITNNNSKALFKKCLQRETGALNLYESLLERDELIPGVRALIVYQYEELKHALTKLKLLGAG
jgi:hypothetical protein